MICDVCGSPDVVAISPGTDAQAFADLFTVVRPEPMRVWCCEHWPCRPAGIDLAALSALLLKEAST